MKGRTGGVFFLLFFFGGQHVFVFFANLQSTVFSTGFRNNCCSITNQPGLNGVQLIDR